MRKTIFLAAALPLVCIGMLTAKPQQNPSHRKSVSTVQGCLKASTTGFVLKTENGITYQLIGDTTEITELVGKEVEINGVLTPGTDLPTGLSARSGELISNSRTGTSSLIEVSKAIEVAHRCGREDSREVSPSAR